MNESEFKGKWNQLKGKVQQRWGKLTNDTMDVISGSKNKLIGRVQEAYGKRRADAEREVNEFLTRHA